MNDVTSLSWRFDVHAANIRVIAENAWWRWRETCRPTPRGRTGASKAHAEAHRRALTPIGQRPFADWGGRLNSAHCSS